MGYQTAPHGSLGLHGGLHQFMALTEGTALQELKKPIGKTSSIQVASRIS